MDFSFLAKQMFLLVLLTLIAVPARSQSTTPDLPKETPIRWSAETAYYSEYVWRGFADYNGGSWQNTLRGGWKNIQVSWWIESGMQHDQLMEVREHDLDVHLEQTFKGNSVSAGYTGYFVVLGEQSSHELYATISRGNKTVGTFGVYQNVGSLAGTYFNASLTRSFQLRPALNLQLASAVGFNRQVFINDSTFSDASFTATLTRSAQRGLSLSPMIGFSKGLNSRYFHDYVYAGAIVRFGSD